MSCATASPDPHSQRRYRDVNAELHAGPSAVFGTAAARVSQARCTVPGLTGTALRFQYPSFRQHDRPTRRAVTRDNQAARHGSMNHTESSSLTNGRRSLMRRPCAPVGFACPDPSPTPRPFQP